MLYGNPQEDRGMIWTAGRVNAFYVPVVPKPKGEESATPIRSAKLYLSPQWPNSQYISSCLSPSFALDTGSFVPNASRSRPRLLPLK